MPSISAPESDRTEYFQGLSKFTTRKNCDEYYFFRVNSIYFRSWQTGLQAFLYSRISLKFFWRNDLAFHISYNFSFWLGVRLVSGVCSAVPAVFLTVFWMRRASSLRFLLSTTIICWLSCFPFLCGDWAPCIAPKSSLSNHVWLVACSLVTSVVLIIDNSHFVVMHAIDHLIQNCR